MKMRRIFWVAIFAVVLIVYLYKYEYLSKPDVIYEKLDIAIDEKFGNNKNEGPPIDQPKNPIDNDTLFIYNVYLTKYPRKEKPNAEWRIKTTVFANCHVKEGYKFSDFTFTNSDGKNYTAKIWSMDDDCYVAGYTPGCYWGPYIIEAIIPDEDANKIGDWGYLSYKNRYIKIPKIIKTKPREKPEIGVCVAPMYWFSNWPKLIEFIEIWRVLGASKFYFYYQSVTREVYEIFKEYEKLGIVVPIKAEVMPTNKETGFNPDSWLFRIGDRVFQNDCIMRSETRYSPYVDVDEILIPQNDQTLLEFLHDEEKKQKEAGAIGFNHAGLQYDAEKMPFLKAKKDEFDWRKIDFSYLKTAQYADIWKMGKAVSLPDRTELISIHYSVRHGHGYHEVNVPHEKGVYYHSRVSWAAASKTEIDKQKSEKAGKFDPKLRRFFTDDLVKKVHDNYVKIMENVEKSMGRKPYPYYEVFQILDKCMEGWKNYHKCSPYEMCYKSLSNVTEWVYANPNDYEARDLIAL